jgi:hypothetical protein
VAQRATAIGFDWDLASGRPRWPCRRSLPAALGRVSRLVTTARIPSRKRLSTNHTATRHVRCPRVFAVVCPATVRENDDAPGLSPAAWTPALPPLGAVGCCCCCSYSRRRSAGCPRTTLDDSVVQSPLCPVRVPGGRAGFPSCAVQSRGEGSRVAIGSERSSVAETNVVKFVTKPYVVRNSPVHRDNFDNAFLCSCSSARLCSRASQNAATVASHIRRLSELKSEGAAMAHRIIIA